MTEPGAENNVRRLPRVAVAMPAYNAAPFIAQAIESVLAQRDVDVELIVVDDASTDDTVDIATRYEPRGARVLRNTERRGIGFSHNRVIAESSAPLIAHVDADDVIVPGALRKLIDAVTSSDRIGQAYCDFYPIDQEGAIAPGAMEQARQLFARHRRPPIDHRRELVVHGMVVSALRTYKREALERVGGFDERLPWAVDYEMALRLAEHYEFAHVPELLYGRRIHPASVTQGLRARPLRYWLMRQRLVRRQLRAQRAALFGQGALATHGRLLLGLAYAVRALITSSTSDS
jgi:glycosyltransferase involved in cell wall biosynthesis